MPSVNVDKFTMAQMFFKCFRHNARLSETHSNDNIIPELESENVYLAGRDCYGMYDRFKDEAASVDALEPPIRKMQNRVVGLGCVIYPPTKLTEDDIIRKMIPDKETGQLKQVIYVKPEYRERFVKFCQESITELEKQFHGQAYGATIHFDEVNEYIDPDTGENRISLPHMHVYFLARAEVMEKVTVTDTKTGKEKEVKFGTGRYRINGKEALPRSKYKEINKSLDDICLSIYGKLFSTTTKGANHKNLNAMKMASSKALDEKLASQYGKIQTLNNDIRDLKEKKAKLDADTLESAELQSEIDTKTQAVQKLEKKIKDLKTNTAKALEELDKIVVDKSTAEEEIADKTQEISDLDMQIADKYRDLFIADKQRAFGKKTLVDDRVLENMNKFYNSSIQRQVYEERDALKNERKQLEKDKMAFKQEKSQYKWNSEGQYKEKAEEYEQLKSELFLSREELEKSLKDDTLSNAQRISLVRRYALFQPESHKNAILKTCDALEKIDSYTTKSLIQRNRRLEKEKEKVFTEENFDFADYDLRIKDMIGKSYDFEGRNEIFQKELKELWSDIKKDNEGFWKAHPKAPKSEGMIRLESLIPKVIQTAFQAIRSYIQTLQRQKEEAEQERE